MSLFLSYTLLVAKLRKNSTNIALLLSNISLADKLRKKTTNNYEFFANNSGEKGLKCSVIGSVLHSNLYQLIKLIILI